MRYYDYAATCPLDKDAAEIYIKTAVNHYGNTQSLHDIGSNAADLLENCRSELARLVGVPKEGLYFTSGGSESNFLAIHALLSAAKKAGKHIISAMAEHSSIGSTLKKLEIEGYEITRVPFNQSGVININELLSAIREDTVVITIQHVNPEIGTVQPIEEIGKVCKQQKILFHSDFVQSFGKIALPAAEVDSFSVSGHKIYGPKGVGAVYINPNLACLPFYPETSHEQGFRPGTLNVPAIAAMTVALQKAYKRLPDYFPYFNNLRAVFMESIRNIKDQITIYKANHEAMQLPSIIGLRIFGLEGQWVMLECNRRGLAISTGTACQTRMQAPSKTMKALNIKDSEAKQFIRISFGWETTEDDVRVLGDALVRIKGGVRNEGTK